MTTKPTPQEMLALMFWGWQTSAMGEGPELQYPLPPTEKYPAVARAVGTIQGMTHVAMPPYVKAELFNDVLHVSLFEGDGWRVGYDRATKSDAACLYPDSVDLPPEWVAPINEALKLVAAQWPERVPVFRPQDVARDLIPIPGLFATEEPRADD